MEKLTTYFSYISHYFIANKPISYLVIITLVFLGFVAFLITPKQYNPEITRPAFAISLQYKGATLDQAADRIVYELTEKIGVVPGVEDIYTTVYDGAQIDATVIFEVGYDETKAKVDLIAQLDQHSYRAQGFISSPDIREINPETIPVLQVVFTDNTQSIEDLRSLVQSFRKYLIAVEGVSEIDVVGGYVPSLVVEVNTEKMHVHGITLNHLFQVLPGSQRRDVYEGIEINEQKTQLVIDTPFQTAEELLNLPIFEDVILGQVASVYKGTAGPQPVVTHTVGDERTNAIMLSVAKIEGSNAPSVTASVVELLDQLVGSNDIGGLRYEIVADDGMLASQEISGLGKNLLTSILIVSVVLFLFLSARAAFVVLITIPLTFLVVFGLGYLLDETINRITLFALILSLGLLVDATIVVTESIYAYLQRIRSFDDRDWGVAQAVGAVSLGLLLSLITSVIVFLPMNYITGMMGPYMGPIAFFVPTALIISFFVALIVTPFLASRLIKVDKNPPVISRFVQNIMSGLTVRYRVFLEQVLASRVKQKRVIRISFMVFFLSLLLPLFGVVHFQMLPGADKNQIYTYIDMPADSSIESTTVVTRMVEQLINNHDKVKHTQAFIGQAPIIDFNGLFKGVQDRNKPYQATIRVNLEATSNRDISSKIITQELRSKISDYSSFDNVDIRFIEEPPGPPVRATVEARVYTQDNDLRIDTANILSDKLGTIDGVTDLYVDSGDLVDRIVLTPNPSALRHYDVSLDAVYQKIALLSGPQVVGEFRSADSNEYSPLLITLPYARDSIDRLNMTSSVILSQSGEIVPLNSIIHRSYEPRPSWQTYEHGQVFTGVTAELNDRPVVYVIIELIRDLVQNGLGQFTVNEWGLFDMELLTDAGDRVYIEWGGEWEMTLENFRDLGIAMGVALLLVYAVLVARYQSFSTPALILMTVPLGLIGILLGFTVLDNLFGIYLTATALIGFIALIGIVVNNAIIYLEYVEYAVTSGSEWREALVEAGSKRLRPIMLTSLTTVLASLTIATDPVWSGLAWAIVFGLSISTVLTLFIYPVLLVYFRAEKHSTVLKN